MERISITSDIFERELNKEKFQYSFPRKHQVTSEFIQRLGLEKELEGHNGCVNCLEWNTRGDLLASGSDDFHVILWDPLRYRKLHTLKTAHQGNIFSVKFLPSSNDSTLVTGAADNCVSLQDIEKGRTLTTYRCHMGRVKRLATTPAEPSMVWSVGEDGVVMQYDTRLPCRHQDSRCGNLLLNLNTFMGPTAEGKCLNLNPIRPELMAVGCNDPYVRLYDRRMLSLRTVKYPPNWDTYSTWDKQNLFSVVGTQDPAQFDVPIGAARYFISGHIPFRVPEYRKRYRTLACTYVVFSPDGSSLLANLGGEQIYLFDVSSRTMYSGGAGEDRSYADLLSIPTRGSAEEETFDQRGEIDGPLHCIKATTTTERADIESAGFGVSEETADRPGETDGSLRGPTTTTTKLTDQESADLSSKDITAGCPAEIEMASYHPKDNGRGPTSLYTDSLPPLKIPTWVRRTAEQDCTQPLPPDSPDIPRLKLAFGHVGADIVTTNKKQKTDNGFGHRPEWSDTFDNAEPAHIGAPTSEPGSPRTLPKLKLINFGASLSDAATCDRLPRRHAPKQNGHRQDSMADTAVQRVRYEAVIRDLFDLTVITRPSPPNGVNHVTDVALLEGRGEPALSPLADVLKGRANQIFERRKYTEAIGLYNRAIALDPKSAILLGNRAAALMKREWDGDIYAAMRDCLRALELNPGHLKARFRMIRCLLHLDKVPEATACLERFKQKFPEYAASGACRTLETEIAFKEFHRDDDKLRDKDLDAEAEGDAHVRFGYSSPPDRDFLLDGLGSDLDDDVIVGTAEPVGSGDHGEATLPHRVGGPDNRIETESGSSGSGPVPGNRTRSEPESAASSTIPATLSHPPVPTAPDSSSSSRNTRLSNRRRSTAVLLDTDRDYFAHLDLDNGNPNRNTHHPKFSVPAKERSWKRGSRDYSKRFCGHCNTTTDIKEANFFGSDGQYVVAGSDDGYFFIWERATTNICRVLLADDSIVNCLQPHPSTCLLATSGIDPVIRLWSPRPENNKEEREVTNLDDAAAANQKRMNADPIEVMLMNMGYRVNGAPTTPDSQRPEENASAGTVRSAGLRGPDISSTTFHCRTN